MKKDDLFGDSVARISLLYDFYGQLLSRRQREVMNLYHEENLSLTEIAEEFGISKQGVHDTLKKGEASLADYEKKLGLVERLIKTQKIVENIEHELCIIENQCDCASNGCVKDGVETIRKMLSSLEM